MRLKHGAAVLSSLVLCAQAHAIDGVSDVLISKVVTSRVAPACAGFAPTADVLADFFGNAKLSNAAEHTQAYPSHPCYAEGTARHKNQSCRFRINAGATASLSCSGETVLLACDRCQQNFPNGGPTYNLAAWDATLSLESAMGRVRLAVHREGGELAGYQLEVGGRGVRYYPVSEGPLVVHYPKKGARTGDIVIAERRGASEVCPKTSQLFDFSKRDEVLYFDDIVPCGEIVAVGAQSGTLILNGRSSKDGSPLRVTYQSASGQLAQDGIVYSSDMWPGEGIPTLYAVSDRLSVHTSPSVGSPQRILKLKPQTQLLYERSRVLTLVSTFVAAERDFKASCNDVPMTFSKGKRLEYLSYRGEGSGVFRINGRVCEVSFGGQPSLQAPKNRPATQWWVQLRRAGAPWLLVSGNREVREGKRVF